MSTQRSGLVPVMTYLDPDLMSVIKQLTEQDLRPSVSFTVKELIRLAIKQPEIQRRIAS